MVVRIDALTTDQVAQAPQWVQRWVDWSLDCAPVDHDRVEDGIRRLYAYAGEQPPCRVDWVRSPRPGEVEAEHYEKSVVARGTNPWRGVGYPGGIPGIQRALNERMDRAANDQLFRFVQFPVHGETAFVWAAAHALSGAEVRVADPRRPSVATPLHRPGQTAAAAALSFLREVCDLDLDWREFDALRDASAAGRWWPYPDRVVVTERAEAIRTEPCEAPHRAGSSHTRRLHAEDGPAVRWRGAAPVYVLHGVRVPGDLVTQGWRPGRILREPNAEVRRLAIERLGWDAFVSGAGLLRVHPPVPDPGNPGRTLTLYNIRGLDPPVRLLLCHNASPERDGTVRRYGLWVPATIDDAVVAAAWTFDVDAATYSQLERAT